MSDNKPIKFQRMAARRKPKGRVVDKADLAATRAILKDAPRDKDHLIENLHRIQDSEGCLPQKLLAALASEMNLPMAAVYEVATFYHHFDIIEDGDSPPAITVRVCRSLSCDMAGAEKLMTTLQEIVGEQARVIAAPCVGRCAAAPVAVVGQNAIEQATTNIVAEAVAQRQIAPVIPTTQIFADYQKDGGYNIYRECLNNTRTVDDVIEQLEQSNLRGLGGAGFPVARKWKIVRDIPGSKVVAINIDEGEPGTFKDRFYLEQTPHYFLEGTLIAAWAIAAADIYLYLRDEYHGCRVILEQELAKLASADFAMPRIHLRRGAGAYICGEESAMIESIEGTAWRAAFTSAICRSSWRI